MFDFLQSMNFAKAEILLQKEQSQNLAIESSPLSFLLRDYRQAIRLFGLEQDFYGQKSNL